jgi:hypothetical protein
MDSRKMLPVVVALLVLICGITFQVAGTDLSYRPFELLLKGGALVLLAALVAGWTKSKDK